MRIISLVVLVGGGVERGDYKQNSEENYDPGLQKLCHQRRRLGNTIHRAVGGSKNRRPGVEIKSMRALATNAARKRTSTPPSSGPEQRDFSN